MKKIIIAINGQFTNRRLTGQERFAYEMVSALDGIPPSKNIKWVLVVPSNANNIPQLSNIEIVKFGKARGSLWEQTYFAYFLIRHHALSLNLCSIMPVISPGIVCIHDLSYKVNPQYFRTAYAKISQLWHKFQYQLAWRFSPIIFTVSEFSKQQMIDIYNVSAERVLVIGNGWEHFQRIRDDESLQKRKPELFTKPFFFSLGSLAPNKNIEWILNVAKAHPQYNFFIAGNANLTAYGKDYKECDYMNVKFLGYLPDVEIKTLMRKCKAFIFPSFFEGFGIPPLEALSVGAKIIVAKSSCLPEIFDDSAYYINPYDTNINLDVLLEGHVKEGEAILKKYSFPAFAKTIHDALLNKYGIHIPSIEMLNELRAKYGSIIEDVDKANDFLKDLIGGLGRLSIVDFLDGRNWDNIKAFEVDKENELIYLYWFLPEKDADRVATRRTLMPYDYYGVVLHFQEIEFISGKDGACLGVVFRGYTPDKKLSGIVENGIGVLEKNDKISFFSTYISGKKNGKTCLLRFMNTPIASFWIFPKDVRIYPSLSKKLLYLYNLDECMLRLNDAKDKLDKITHANVRKRDRDDDVCNIGNNMRRVAEKLFKLVLCFYDGDWKLKNIKYNELRIGDLIGVIKKSIYKTSEDTQSINKIPELGNLLSHENGLPINTGDAYTLHNILLQYAERFEKDVVKSDEIVLPDFPSKPSPQQHINDNFYKWNFSGILADFPTEENNESKLLFLISYQPNTISFTDLLSEERTFLCKDGYFKKLNTKDTSTAFPLYDRETSKKLQKQIYKDISKRCEDNGYEGKDAYFCCDISIELKKRGNPIHLFTRDEIKELMQNADDSQNNKLVINEDGYACLIHNVNDGCLYPVTYETWCAGNGYVGTDSELPDLDECYQMSLQKWLRYLETGEHVCEEIFPFDYNEPEIISKIQEITNNHDAVSE